MDGCNAINERLEGVEALNESEMKLVEAKTNDCPKGMSEEECIYSCAIELPDGRLTGGSCHYSGIGSICACVRSDSD